MARYEIKYKKECECVMTVEANSEEEAINKYKEFDCISDYEVQGISEEVINVKLK